MGKPVLCLDFDGVIHSYTTGWHGEAIAPDPPVPGAIRWIAEATQHWSIHIFSSRSSVLAGRQAMRDYIVQHAHFDLAGEVVDELMTQLKFPETKPPALLSIDDRAITFQGNWDALESKKLLKFQPWNKRSSATGLYKIHASNSVVHLEMAYPVTSISWTREAALEFARNIVEAAENS